MIEAIDDIAISFIDQLVALELYGLNLAELLEMYTQPSNHSLNATESFIDANEKNDIILPMQVKDIDHIAVDIGGSLAKIVWFSKQSQGGRLNFAKFETSKIHELIDFVRQLLGHRNLASLHVRATGGGSHKYYDLLVEKLGMRVQREDEMMCLITGLNFLVRQIEYEVFTYDERRSEAINFEQISSDLFPYMLVNIGSGVSILKVTSEDTYERISGTSLGGGTLMGLLGLLTNAKDYEEMLALSKQGDNKNVDMLVGDIYGGDYNKIGLKSSTIASSFGKIIKSPPEERKAAFKQEDIAISLLYLVSNNIGQIAYLNAQAHGLDRIFFSGFYISGHSITMNTLSYAISYWSQGKIKANFLRHEGYLGALGAFISDPPANSNLKAFTENFSQAESMGDNRLYAVGALDSSDLKPFPLLYDALTYNPDTSNLSDPKAKLYWIDLLGSNLKHLVDLATKNKPDLNAKAAQFEDMYRQHLSELRQTPNAYGILTVRSLLNLREQCLREMGFNDIFRGIKIAENIGALAKIDEIFKSLDKLQGGELVEALLNNIMAGNMYDWGSTAIQEMLEEGLDFSQAKSQIVFNQKLNNIDCFKIRLLAPIPYKKVMIFVDNSGADVVLGIIPFVRYLLQSGCKVILAGNTYPSVNDITATELIEILGKIDDSTIIKSTQNSNLLVVATGSNAPCLDFLRMSGESCSAAEGVDLIIIEGMGRAIQLHTLTSTNFRAKFSVDSLKIGVFKNSQIALELGANLYDGLLLFQPKA